MVKKFYSVILSLIMLLSCNVMCFALATDETEVQPYYTYTDSVNTMLKISNGSATCVSSILGKNGTTKVKITMTLEKKVLFWWSEKETWTQTFNSKNGTLSKTYSVADSGTYRITAEYIAYGTSGSETTVPSDGVQVVLNMDNPVRTENRPTVSGQWNPN